LATDNPDAICDMVTRKPLGSHKGGFSEAEHVRLTQQHLGLAAA
jgi:hypothetical protein